MTAWTFELVQKVFSDGGCTLLNISYINNKQPLDFICKCGNKGTRTLSTFLKSPFCKVCGYTNTGTKNDRKSYEEVLNEFTKRDYELLSTEYKNNNQLLEYICDCGNTHKMSLANIKKNKKCPNCYNKHWWNIEKVKEIFSEYGCELLENSYTNSNIGMDYICSCGNKSNTSLGNFLKGVRCKICGIQKITGKNHYLYDHNKTQEEREHKREYTEYRQWRKNVFVRDNFTCQCCNKKGTELHAHHLESYSFNYELRTILENGVTLCRTCHDKFHKKYGFFTPTTKQQYIEFIGDLNG